MRNIIIVLIFFCLTSYAEAKDLQLFNTAVLGESTNNAVKLLQDKQLNNIVPLTIMVDVKNGKYYASTIQYPKELSFSEARASLNKWYKKYEKENFADNPSIGLWRNEDDGYAIHLLQEEDVIKVLYIQFMSNEELFECLSDCSRKNTNEK